MKPDTLLKKLKKACPTGLESVVLYGSAAAGDHSGSRSDYNVLVITVDLGLQTLKAIAPAAADWAKAGNPPPLLFTRAQLRDAADVFPIELLDIRDSHRVLFGNDVVAGLAINVKNLRLEIEHELRGNLIRLRQRYLLSQGNPKAVADLLIHSLSTFLVLFRAALRLFEEPVPRTKMDALERFAVHVPLDTAVFQVVQELKSGSKKLKDVDVNALFGEYLIVIENVVQAVDAYIHKGE